MLQLQPAFQQGGLPGLYCELQGDEVQTAACLDKQMQQTGSSRLALTEPDLMLVRVLPVCPLLVACELRVLHLQRSAVIAFKACHDFHEIIVQVFGKAFTLGGYPPWPIRVTEMYYMGRLQCMSSTQLQTTLQQYCNTLQRFGA